MHTLRASGKEEALRGVEHQGQACWVPRGDEEERRSRREAEAKTEKNEGGRSRRKARELLKGGRGEK